MNARTDVHHLTEQELADRLGVSVKTVRGWRMRGGGPGYRKYGSAVRYALTDVEAFEAAAVRSSTSDPGPQVAK